MCNENRFSESGSPIAPTRCAEYVALKEENARLREALKAVEWVQVPRQTPHDAGWRHCPICKWPSMGCEHSPSCVIGNALKEVG